MFLLGAVPFFKEQVSVDVLALDIFYTLATVCLFLLVTGIGLIDAGLVRRKNVLDGWIQKILASLIAGISFMFVGYGIWNWQYFQAFGVHNSLGEAIKAWWLGGTNFMHFAQRLDPAASPEADVFQVFAVFFVAYAAVIAVLLHGAVIERIKAVPMYIISAVAGGIAMPLLAYLTWGSTSPLTNRGLHDYMGAFSLYIFVGVWALILAWRVGPRHGYLKPHAMTSGPAPHNLGLTAAGVGLVLFAVPFLALGCGFFFPGIGYFGISMTESGWGIALVNIFVAYSGGAIGGAIIGYWKKNPVMALLGPVAGYIGASTSIDVVHPWEMLLISFFAPFIVFIGYTVMKRIGIDEIKVVPLALFGGTYGAIISGFVAWHTKTGGYPGLTGKYGFQHAEITPWWQFAGVGTTIGLSAISGIILIVGLEKTIGLRVSEKAEIDGLDATYWQSPPPPLDDVAPGWVEPKPEWTTP